MTVVSDAEPSTDPAWFTFRAWLGREGDKSDDARVRQYAREVREGTLGASVEYPLPVGLREAREEHQIWFSKAWPASAAGRTAAQRQAEAEAARRRALQPPAPPTLEPFADAETARAVAELVDVLADVQIVIGELVRFVHVEGIPERLRPRWLAVNARLEGLRRAASVFAMNTAPGD